MSAALPADLQDQVTRALREDIGSGDVTAQLLPVQQAAHARVLCRDAAVLCGRAWFDAVFRQIDSGVRVHWLQAEGAAVAANTVLCELEGPARAILTGERTALNFLQLLSYTATITARYVAAVAGTGCRIIDTRKTIPGLRTAQKYAVVVGGGQNHRIGLYDRVLIKENHIAAAGSIAAAVQKARQLSPTLAVEVETENLDEVRQALAADADIIMLDELSPDHMRTAVELNRQRPRRALVECSGGVNLESIRSLAETGVDCISIGSLTKHVQAIDLSMRLS
ncbi:MAG: carboxylating nicotinate-nucleotide diphosphorylase [Steroidobacteraceae bacterium]